MPLRTWSSRRKREIREGTVTPCFLATGQTSSGSRSTALRLPPNIPSRKHGCLVLPVLLRSFFFALSFSLFIRWLIQLFSPSPLVLLYFYSLSPTADLYSPVYRPLPLSKFHTVLPSCIEWTYPTSICHDQQCYNYQSAILKSITLKYFINVIYIFFIFDSIQILIIFYALLIADSLISL